MSTLTNLYMEDAYSGLLHANASPLPSTGQQVIYDGVGNASALSLGRSGNGATFTGTVTVDDLVIIGTSLIDKIWPVGSVYFSAYEEAVLFNGWGTWVRIAEGRFIAGTGTGTDASGYSYYLPAGNDTVGEYNVTLTIEQMAPHVHSNIGTSDTLPTLGLYGSTFPRINTKPLSGNIFPVFEGSSLYTSYSGGSKSHNNIPPSFGLYAWERIL